MKKAYLFTLVIISIISISCKKTETSNSNYIENKKDSINIFTKLSDGFEYTKLGLACKNNNLASDGNHYYCVGGNQGGVKGARTVKISKYSKTDIDWFVIPPDYKPEKDEYKLKIMTSEADIDSSSSTRS